MKAFLALLMLQFETLGDAMYMAVSGVPEKKINHAEPMAAMALDMMETMKDVRDPATNVPLTLSIGKEFVVLLNYINVLGLSCYFGIQKIEKVLKG